MTNIRKLLVAAVAGIVFMATPAHASCLQETTEALAGLQRQIGTENPGPDYIRQAIKSDPNGAAQLAKNISPDLSQSCQDLARQNVLAYAGLSQPAEPAAKPASAPSSAPAPQPAASQQSGGGAMIDRKIEALEAEIAKLKASGGGNPAELVALQADMASLKAEKAQPGRPINTTKVVRETTLVNQGLNKTDREELGLWSSSRDGIMVALNRLFGSGEDNPKTSKREGGIIGSLQANDAQHTQDIADLKASSSSWWTPRWWWFLIVAVAIAGAYFLARRGLAKSIDLKTKADQSEVDELKTKVEKLDERLTDTEHQVGKKNVAISPSLTLDVMRLKEGEELTTIVVVGTSDTPSEHGAFNVVIRKGVDRESFIVSGVEGHTVTNPVRNLTAALRKAAYDGRLTTKVEI